MEGIRVMKFGGTSVGDAERIAAAAELVRQHGAGRATVVVISAMAGVTDLLMRAAQAAARGTTEEMEKTLATIRSRHLETAEVLLPPSSREAFAAAALQFFGEVENTCEGIARLGHCPLRALDGVLACGEKLSALLLASALEQVGLRAQAVDATSFLVTDSNFGEASPLMEISTPRTRQALLPLLENSTLPVVTGFIGATIDGAPTTLGRGGSDFSAALIAASLSAADVWIWTDVDGIFSADPALVPEAQAIPSVTYQEAAELSFYGAKVLHPKTLAPLADRDIPVFIKSSFAPEKPGTKISRNGTGTGGRAVTALRDAVLITVESRGEFSAVQLIGRAFTALSFDSVDVLMLSQASREESFCFAVTRRDAHTVLRRLHEAFALELAHDYVRPFRVQEGMGVLALVGSGMRGSVGIAGKLFGALAAEGINVVAIAQGSSETNISVIVEESALAPAVRAVHRAMLAASQPQAQGTVMAPVNCS